MPTPGGKFAPNRPCFRPGWCAEADEIGSGAPIDPSHQWRSASLILPMRVSRILAWLVSYGVRVEVRAVWTVL